MASERVHARHYGNVHVVSRVVLVSPRPGRCHVTAQRDHLAVGAPYRIGHYYSIAHVRNDRTESHRLQLRTGGRSGRAPGCGCIGICGCTGGPGRISVRGRSCDRKDCQIIAARQQAVLGSEVGGEQAPAHIIPTRGPRAEVEVACYRIEAGHHGNLGIVGGIICVSPCPRWAPYRRQARLSGCWDSRLCTSILSSGRRKPTVVRGPPTEAPADWAWAYW